MFDYLVFIGRFQPFHNGHLHVIEQALKETKKLIIVIGSANVARSERNPFTYEERQRMIQRSLAMYAGRIIFRPSNDFLYSDEEWVAEIQKTVHDAILSETRNANGWSATGYKDFKIGLVGYAKDHTSYYLKKFPEWGSLNIPTQFSTINSTDIRNAYIQPLWAVPKEHTPLPVWSFMEKFAYTETFKWLIEERRANQYYDPRKYDNDIVCCVDAVCIQSGHVLLVTRKEHPGKGLLALAGGHVDKKERFKDAVIRELREETHISDLKGEIPPAMLASFIKAERLFDNPTRSLRARVISMAYLFKFPDSRQLYKVRADDDAAEAKWYKLGELRADQMFEDHWHIINTMIGYNKD